MEKEQYRQPLQRQHTRQQAARATDAGRHCPKCGAPVTPDALFCEECGTSLPAHTCISCGAEIAPGVVICPQCGHPATTMCTFCGSEMNAGDAFCPECGNSRSGITCPECGTLNFRSFCRKCNHPLNPMALYAVEQAKADPRYQRACRLAEEIADMEEELARLEAAVAREKAAAAEPLLQVDDSVSEETRRLMEEFERLSREASPIKARPAAPKPAPKPEAAPPKPAEFKIEAPAASGGSDIEISGPRGGISETEKRLAALKASYAEKVAEFQREIDQMVPNPADPPEIQRNFACAHKVTIRATTYVKEKKRIGWICNQCHVFHNNPSECCVAEYGGKWITKEILVATETTRTDTINF